MLLELLFGYNQGSVTDMMFFSPLGCQLCAISVRGIKIIVVTMWWILICILVIFCLRSIGMSNAGGQ